MILLRKSSSAWSTIACAAVLGCGGQVDGHGSVGSTDGTGGAGLGGSLVRPATGGAVAEQGAGGSSANAGAAAAAGGAMSTTCEYPIAPLPPGGVACDDTVQKGGTCTTEGAVCYTPCGPVSSGWSSKTCLNGAYVAGVECLWTAADYSAFRVPSSLAELDPTCPYSTPQAATPCAVPPCIVCADRTTGGYYDASGAAKSGWCICVTTVVGVGTWTCVPGPNAWTSPWPCPGQPGC